MYRRVRNWFVIGALLILAAGYARFRMNEGLPVFEFSPATADTTSRVEDAMVVERGDIRVSVSATGNILPEEQAALFFTAPGKVSAVYVAEGDRVAAGQVLAQLDAVRLEQALEDASLALALQEIALEALTAEPREEDLTVARAAVYAASAQLDSARSDPDPRGEEISRLQYEIARNRLWQIQLERDSAQATADQLAELEQELNARLPSGVSLPLGQLAPSTSSAEAGIDQAEFGVAIAEQQLQGAQNAEASSASIAAASAAIVGAQAQLDSLLDGPDEYTLAIADARLQQAYLAVELARYQLSLTQLKAPFDGVIAALNLVEGENPPTTRAAIELFSDALYYIDLSVDEMDIAAVQPGQLVEIELDALPGELLAGTVARIDNIGTSFGGLVTYTVRVALEPTTFPVRVGMSATATIVVDEAFDVLRLRNRFIRIDRRTGQAFARVRQADGTLREVELVLGRRNETFSEVVSGLQVGDEVVLLPRTDLTDFGF